MNPIRRRLGYDRPFRWRGTETSRLESFSDAVFAFALTLIVVTLEPPTRFADLTAALAKFPGFAVAFLFLLMIWAYHTLFFRRYGLDDLRTLVLNSLLMFVVLFYVYPMRFLVGVLADVTLGNRGWTTLQLDEWRWLLTVYGFGFAAVYAILLLMYRHARRHAADLDLSPTEVHMTRAMEGAHAINVGAGVLSIAIVQLGPVGWSIPIAGWSYGLLWPAHVIHGKWQERNQPAEPPSAD